MTILPTTAGSVWAVQIVTGDTSANPITSANGWTLCPTSCNAVSSAAFNQDAAYKVGGSAGTTSITVTLTSAPSGFYGIAFVELLPPSGYTASLDKTGATVATGCTACVGVPLTLTATDAIIQFQEEQGNDGNQGWNAWNSPYITDPVNNGIYLNATSGAAPTLNQTPSGTINFSALAFKSTAGSFSYATPSPLFTLVANTPASASGVSCSPTCSLTIPSTGSGHLLFVAVHSASSSDFLSSASGGGTWVVPSGAGTCKLNNSTTIQESCGYVLSSTSGVTSITFTMSASGTYGFTTFEVSRSTGSFMLDTEGSTTISTSTLANVGPALTLGGTNDVIFQQAGGQGFINNVTYYPQPYVATAAGFQVYYDPSAPGDNAASAILLNTANGAAATWLPQVIGYPLVLTAIAFK
jgi:hypothetical protein